MKLNIVYKAEAPIPPYTQELIDIDVQSVPFMLYGCWLKSQQYFWRTPEDAKYGRWLMNIQGASLLMPGSLDIVNAVDRIYNLLDARITAIARDVTGTGTPDDPFVYDPPMQQAATLVEAEDTSLLWLAQNSYYGLRNIADGYTAGDFTDVRNFRQQLEDLIASVSATDDLDADILAKLVEIAALLA